MNLSFKIVLKYKYTLVIARFRVQYDQYFLSFSNFADLFHESLGEYYIVRGKRAITGLSLS